MREEERGDCSRGARPMSREIATCFHVGRDVVERSDGRILVFRQRMCSTVPPTTSSPCGVNLSTAWNPWVTHPIPAPRHRQPSLRPELQDLSRQLAEIDANRQEAQAATTQELQSKHAAVERALQEIRDEAAKQFQRHSQQVDEKFASQSQRAESASKEAASRTADEFAAIRKSQQEERSSRLESTQQLDTELKSVQSQLAEESQTQAASQESQREEVAELKQQMAALQGRLAIAEERKSNGLWAKLTGRKKS